VCPTAKHSVTNEIPKGNGQIREWDSHTDCGKTCFMCRIEHHLGAVLEVFLDLLNLRFCRPSRRWGRPEDTLQKAVIDFGGSLLLTFRTMCLEQKGTLDSLLNFRAFLSYLT
jgi:hypothetical protein